MKEVMKTNYLKPVVAALALILVTFNSYAQDVPEDQLLDAKPFGDKIYVGGNFGLQFGNPVTNINVSPLVGYRFTERFSSGVGATYQYYKNSDFNFETSIYGGSVFSRYFFLSNVFAQAEYEMVNFDHPILIGERKWFGSTLLGGGYLPSRGVYITFLYVVDTDSGSPYSGSNAPYVLRIGVVL